MSTQVISTAPPPSAVPQSPWHSPIPYLFGGLAAMLGLIAFALLILACSYWKLSGSIEDAERDIESGETAGDDEKKSQAPVVFEEKFLVIMAGQDKPTYLATAISSRTSSFGSKSLCRSTSSCDSSKLFSEEGNSGRTEVVNVEVLEAEQVEAEQVLQ